MPAPLDLAAAKPFADESAPQASVLPLVSGTLYTNGAVKVDWNGIRMPVENTTYVYTGGEVVDTAPDAMGILKLDDGGSIFICPNSRLRLSRDSSGVILLEVLRGGGRFVFDNDERFVVRVNDAMLTSAPKTADETLKPQRPYTGEAETAQGGGCVLCNLSSNLTVSVEDRGSKRSRQISAGEVVSVRGRGERLDGQADADELFSVMRLPEHLFASIRASLNSNGARGIGYLCKCGALRDYAADAGSRQARGAGIGSEGELAFSTTLASADDGAGDPFGDAAPSFGDLPDDQPAVEPPPVPGVTVADAAEPDPFLPGLLPAAGEPSDSQPVVVLPPPLVPGSGSGGGGVVSGS